MYITSVKADPDQELNDSFGDATTDSASPTIYTHATCSANLVRSSDYTGNTCLDRNYVPKSTIVDDSVNQIEGLDGQGHHVTTHSEAGPPIVASLDQFFSELQETAMSSMMPIVSKRLPGIDSVQESEFNSVEEKPQLVLKCESISNDQKQLGDRTSTEASTLKYPSTTNYTDAICGICSDRASGRHYGVISCEGCKGFFKRTVRKQVSYSCRGTGQCPVDRRKRTRCQACRYVQCIAKGMRREAVQEERHRRHPTSEFNGPCLSVAAVDVRRPSTQDVNENQTTESTPDPVDPSVLSVSSTTLPPVETVVSSGPMMPVLTLANLLAAELNSDVELPSTEAGASVYVDVDEDRIHPLLLICHSVEQQLPRLLFWARQLACFNAPYLTMDDQFALLKSAWPELLLISAAFNSIVVDEGLLLASGRHLSRTCAHSYGLGPLMDRFLFELVARFREFGLGRVELALLRAIVLFNPDANHLVARDRVEAVRENLYAGLHSYCTASHVTDTSRFTKLLLRLPPLRSIAHKCLEHLVFVKLAAEDPTSRRLINLVQHGVWPNQEVGVGCPVMRTQYGDLQS